MCPPQASRLTAGLYRVFNSQHKVACQATLIKWTVARPQVNHFTPQFASTVYFLNIAKTGKVSKQHIWNENVLTVFESDDSSVVTRWTVDQEILGSNPIHGGNLISVVRSLSEFTQPIRQNEYRLSVAGVLHMSWDLKYESMSFADWLSSVIAPAFRLKTIPALLDTNSTHTGVAYSHLTAPHSFDYMGYVRHVGHAARSRKNHMWLPGLEYAKFSLHEKWNNCLHPYRTVIAERTNYHRPPENTPLGLTLWFHGRDISYKMHSFIHSYPKSYWLNVVFIQTVY